MIAIYYNTTSKSSIMAAVLAQCFNAGAVLKNKLPVHFLGDKPDEKEIIIVGVPLKIDELVFIAKFYEKVTVFSQDAEEMKTYYKTFEEPHLPLVEMYSYIDFAHPTLKVLYDTQKPMWVNVQKQYEGNTEYAKTIMENFRLGFPTESSMMRYTDIVAEEK